MVLTSVLFAAGFVTGWWFCQMKNKRGWVPAAYLEPMDGPDESEEQDPNYAGKKPNTTPIDPHSTSPPCS